MVGADDATSILKPFFGQRAEVWDYTASHSVLRIKLSQSEVDECAIVVFKGCRNIMFNPSWPGFDPNISCLDSNDRILVEDLNNLSVQVLNIYIQGTFTSYADIPDSWMEKYCTSLRYQNNA